MCRTTRRAAFTLIEVLIVVVIMAVLAATIIPQFASSAKDAKESSIKFNLHSLRSQIEMYKMQHNNAYPTGANDLEQLTKHTNQAGTVIPAGGDPTLYPLGGYVQGTSLPPNPFSNSSKVKVINGATTPSADTDATRGYIYNSDTGEIWINETGYLTY